MSMSTLGQQLAAINAPGKNTGSNLATSRRHEDAVGRGLAHSVQIGHALYNKAEKFKASIIHEDARKASDVPLATIRENCVESLRHLETIEPSFGAFVGILCSADAKERGLMMSAENEKVDKRITDLLFRLALVMGYKSNRNSNLVSCLNVIEYLLRKYDIHIRPKTASTMLLAILPHHEEPYFLRILQLIDLANLPEWAFLRPYAIPGARLGRSILAQQASKDITLVRYLGRLSQRNSSLPNAQQSLSFTAAVLVEALTLQTQRKGSMEERTCQALLPFVVVACRNEHYYKRILDNTISPGDSSGDVWQNWGYIMASTMVESGVLAPEPRSVLVTSVLQGLVQQQEAVAATTEEHGLNASWWKDAPSSFSSGIMVALTILAQESSENAASYKDSGYLPLLSSGNTVRNCGFSMMDNDIFKTLLKLDGQDNKTDKAPKKKGKNIKNSTKSTVAACVANLYSRDGIADVEQWIASILVVGWKRFVKYHAQPSDRRSAKARANCCNILNLALNLVKHSHLEKLWKQANGQWVESFTSFVFLNTPLSVFRSIKNASDDSKNTLFTEEDYIKAIFDIIQSLDRVAYERGLTHALIKTKNKEDRMALAKYLGLAKSKQNGADSQLAKEQDDHMQSADSISLPPRVALEHADSQVRLESIPALLREAKESADRMEVDDNGTVLEQGETISQAFLRRFLLDDNKEVALAAAKALDELLLLNKEQITDVMNSKELGEGALEGLYKWAQSSSDEEQRKEQLLVHSCRFASYAAKLLKASNQMNMTYVRLMEGLGATLSSSEITVSQEAAEGIVAAFEGQKGSASEVKNLAKSLLISDNAILQGFQRIFRERSSSELHIRRQLARVVLDAIASSNSSGDISNGILDYCVWIVETFASDFTTAEIELLSKSLKVLTTVLKTSPENIHSIFCRLATCEAHVFRSAIATYISAVCENLKDPQGNDVAPIAVAMEVTLSSDSFDQIRNLLTVATGMASNDATGNFYAVAPALALCCHREEKVRALAVSFLSHLGETLWQSSNKEEWTVLSVVCQDFAKNESLVLLKGASSIPELLAKILSHSKEPQIIQKYLLQAIVSSATGYGAADLVFTKDYISMSWLGHINAIGGCKTANTLLEATENAGETAFPILSRWKYAGQPLLESFQSSFSYEGEISNEKIQLIYTVVKILRGVTTSASSSNNMSSTSTIITTGPTSHGRRARSYSFGKNDGAGVMNPYPTDMQSSIVSILTNKTQSILHTQVRTSLFEVVLCSESWRNNIFCQLNGKIRLEIAKAVLKAAAESSFHSIDSVLLSLPLDANDTATLVSEQESNEIGLSQLTFVSDFISTNHVKLARSPGINELLGSIFKKLSGFSSATEHRESLEFARHALLNALLELTNSSLAMGVKKIFKSGANTLEEIIVGNKSSSSQSVPLRSKRIVFLIFAALCEKYPNIVIQKFIPIITGLVSGSLSQGEGSTLANCFDVAIPAYSKHAAVGNLSLADLCRAFVNRVCEYNEEVRATFYMLFVRALSTTKGSGDTADSPIGSFISVILAREMYSTMGKDRAFSKLPALATQILSHTSSDSRIQAVWTMQNYAKEILFNLLNEESTIMTDTQFSIGHLAAIASKGPKFTGSIPSDLSFSQGSPTTELFEKLSSLLITVTCEVLNDEESRKIIRRTDGSDSKIVLRLWQDLLLVQSACHNRLGGSIQNTNARFLERIVEITTHALDGIQNSLPSHIFLAFVTSLVTEGETEELRARAVQLIAERSGSLYLGKSETVLFVEMIPHLLQLLGDSSGIFLQQSVFAAIDSIGRNSCLSSESSVNDRHLEIFSSAAFKASGVIEKTRKAASGGSFQNIPPESRQLVSSAALCSSTAIKICGPRALPVLPKLIKPLINFQFAASEFLKVADDSVDKKELSQAKLMQVAILRTFTAIIERMPKLLKPYLVDILKSFGEVSGSIQIESLNQSQSIQTELAALQNITTSRIPARQLIPAASKSIMSTPDLDLNVSTLSIMTNSVTKAKSSEVSGMITIIIKTATHVFDQDVNGELAAMEATDKLLLSLVMKLSEMQLRSLYRKLREWRGSLDETKPEDSGKRRCDFWRFSAALSKQLKSIYLSCLTSVFQDAVDELEIAASSLSKKDLIKKSDGKKRQRLSNSGGNIDLEISSIQALKNLLLCLEMALRADAHEGGDWIREMDSQRYEKLLQPLGTLLGCQLPSNSSSASFESIVQGGDTQSGSVVECLVALATAAGDEQLWKPLNHSVLQACSDENRPEVRKAGVTCLLSLINSIGEEYMVLIPECLPILSELLEDSDEEIAGIAQECISQSEELLGESLQDSLR
eukprot:CAMPEP_0172381836 /NCGR_PEP_ID=MMETSP1060-20121228/71153_1 /TAXON_ID=37318 /ORGANISM="Pseudo-nitzschia pungens, Strain cf. cingulata" /LENGTH=2325 /DNA_ID=CAMNT_0013109625 /DNA_START=9 /DNA_END=6986 /DNA_ORIENTATION=+